MKKPISNLQMLLAARRRLAEHMQTVPATAAQAAELAEFYERKAEECRAQAAGYVGTATEFYETDLPGVAGARANYRLKLSMELERSAAHYDLHADAWRTSTDATWDATRDELQGRVDYYEALVRAPTGGTGK